MADVSLGLVGRFALALAGVIAGPLASVAVAATVSVPSAQYPTIQTAINAVVGGSLPDATTINVQPGTYSEALAIGNTNRTLTIRGTGGAGVTIIDAAGKGQPAVKVVRASGTVTFIGLTFRHGTTSGTAAGGGFLVQESSPSLRGLHVRAQYGLRRRGRSADHVQRDLYRLHDSQQLRRALWRRRVYRFGLAPCLHRLRHPGQCLWHGWCRRGQPRRWRWRVRQRRVADIPVVSCQRQHIEVCRRRHFPHGRPRLRLRPRDAGRGRHRGGRQRLEPVPRRRIPRRAAASTSRTMRRRPSRGHGSFAIAPEPVAV